MFNFSAKRKNTNCYKWDAHKDTLPFGVADSDYRAPLAVRLAMHKRICQGAFGYTIPSADYPKILAEWTKREYGYTFKPEQLSQASGIVFAVNVLLSVLTEPSDKIVVQEPVYNAFFEIFKQRKSNVISSDLVFRANRFEIDFVDLEEKLTGAKVFLLCSPHNPIGRVWSKDEVEKIVELCKKHGVILISDEIHCDFVLFGAKFTSAANYFGEYKDIIICNAPSKTFNLAGFFTSNVIFNNLEHKKAFDEKLANSFCNQPNLMGALAAETAYKKCGGWMRRQNKYIEKNYLYMAEKLKSKLPRAVLAKMEGTYLAFIDLTYLGKTDAELEKAFSAFGISLNGGKMYGRNYDGWVRFNLACPMSQLRKGLKRFVACCDALENNK